MKLISLKKTLMTCAALTVLAAPAMANEMINNTTYGVVHGDIIQQTPGYDNDLEVNIGSISSMHSSDDFARGTVEGDIIQNAGGPWGVDDVKMKVNVGAVDARRSRGNIGFAYTEGDIIQEAYDREAVAEVQVGSVDAGDTGTSRAVDTTGFAYIQGDIRQAVGYKSKAYARIGSVTE